ncbi:hypothetical protein Tco_0017370 [Tanacetum coccineum]
MARLDFCDKHNMVAYLEKSAGSEGFEQIIDFLSASHIHFALTANPTIYTSPIQQFWETTTLCTMEDGVQEIFEQLANMGYVTDSDSLTFQKGHFSPQWKFFIHTILYCLSPKKTAWDQFSSNLATAIICLATKRIFNFSKFLFEAMVKNIDSQHMFLDESKQGSMIEDGEVGFVISVAKAACTSCETRRRWGWYYSFQALTINMQVYVLGEGSSISTMGIGLASVSRARVHSLRRDEGSLSLNELTVLYTSLSKKVANLESELKQTKETCSTALTKLILRVKKLVKQVQTTNSRRKTIIVLSEDEDVAEDPSNQGRIIEEIDADTDIILLPKQGRGVGLTQTYTKRRRNVGTGSSGVSTASDSNNTAGGKAKDKGKEIMQEPEPLKKLKKRVQV